eukprot:gnl/Spiro4/4984_TR2485_c0_g1_i1.p1 gnl/Spiro4/4984_TR2485_c0_g1~~gnl/Spiro4/4984_TR2485_c0_g1_i1.p1  ORF type:complete len:397 (+),score=74.44 gnl/Spiro4/4984_TR2485_c0_g1_i1:39-1229(+)
MGIKDLSKLLGDHARRSMREQKLESYFARQIAVDASMCIYQFLVAVRIGEGADHQNLMNEAGEVTSHIQGMFARTINLLKHGIKPIFVFDGKPPELKSGELEKRRERRHEAEEKLKSATEAGAPAEDLEKYSRRLARMTPQHNEDCKRLLRLMGVPVVEAPGEAEAQCAALARAGKAYATASEDLDALTFGTPILIRHLFSPLAAKLPIIEIDLAQALSELQMDMEQFIDLCILCGCDYTSRIPGIGYVRAHKLIKQFRSIEALLPALNKTKYPVNENYLYREAHALFRNPDVLDPNSIELRWTAPDEDGLIQFLVNEKGFNIDRVRTGIAKLRATQGKASQSRLEQFFGPVVRKQPEGGRSKSPPPKRGKTGVSSGKKPAKVGAAGAASSKRGRR